MRLPDDYLARIPNGAVYTQFIIMIILAKSYRDHLQGIHGPICEVCQLENELYHCEDVRCETFGALHMVFGK